MRPTVKYRLVEVLFLLALALPVRAFADSKNPAPLPTVFIDPRKITVSGVSSGGYMAVQLHLSLSKWISGIAAIAGGIYWCSEGGNEVKTFVQCITQPEQINVPTFVNKAREEEMAGNIDPLLNVTNDPVFLMAGTRDLIVSPGQTRKLIDFYAQLVPEKNITTKMDLPAAHGFPTLKAGALCEFGGLPWLLNCGFDTAGEILTKMYGKLLEPAQELPAENLTAFDQKEFTTPAAQMHSTGHVYIPAACKSGAGVPCRLHVALHGCQQSPDHVGGEFRENAGYNRWAESNRIVVLYPEMTSALNNVLGCFDWYGYTDKTNYANRKGPQVDAIRKMIARIAKLPL